jgi:gas vesicle protein
MDEKEKVIQECRKKMRDAQTREEKFKDGLTSADKSIKATKEKIRMLEHSNNTLYDTGNQVMTAQGEWRKEYEEKTQKLREVTQKYLQLE